jgi:beta-ureidopropionase
MKARCALIQLNFGEDKIANTERGAELVREAARDGAQIICLPELATSVYFCHHIDASFFALAEPIPGPCTEIMSRAAREAGVYVMFPLYERAADGQLYNSAAFIGPDGDVQGIYRKNIIPLVKAAKGFGVEKFYFRPGNLGYPVFPTELGVNVAVTICFERHFPEGPRILALNGADVIFAPTASPLGREMWELELQGHAIANGIWVGGTNRVGRDRGASASDMDFFGSAVLVAPGGEIVARGGSDGDEIVHGEIDTEVSRDFRERWGFFRDRRPEIWGAVTAP